jgi:hypothetical protein
MRFDYANASTSTRHGNGGAMADGAQEPGSATRSILM